jgi:membrane protease YdiL (CAAX protease family)
VRSLPAWELWQHSVPWAVRSAAVQGLLLVPTVLLLLLGVGLRSRRELRLRWGEASAPARPDLFTLGTHTSWRWLGPLWTIPLCVGTFTAMLLAIPPDAAGLARLLTLIPAVCIIAALNTVSEEFHFRNVPLAFLPGLLGPRQPLLLTGVYFGLEHFYGNPPGLSGVLLASFIGYWMGKSMLETEGSGWAWLVHWLQDVIIFSFVAMSWR